MFSLMLAVEQTVELLVILDAMRFMWHHSNIKVSPPQQDWLQFAYEQ